MSREILSLVQGLKRKSEREYAGPCPWCEGEDRFIVWPDQGAGGRFLCRRCEKTGDAIDLLRDQGLSFQDASIRVSGISSGKIFSGPRQNLSSFPSKIWQQRAEDFVQSSSKFFTDDFKQLLKARHLTEEAASRFKIGWNSKDHSCSAREWGLEGEKIWVPSGIVIPTLRKSGIVSLKIRRRVQENGPKYVQIKGGSNQSLVLGRVGQPSLIVESELDAFLVNQEAGDLVSVVALGGTQKSLDPDTLSFLEAAPRILIATDFDVSKDESKLGAGQDACLKLMKTFPNAEYFPTAVGKDPTDMQSMGIKVRDWVKCALSPAQIKKVPTIPASIPYDHQNLIELMETYPHLVPCPKTKRPWSWVSRKGCAGCMGHVHCLNSRYARK